jgi:hypothetical protein
MFRVRHGCFLQPDQAVATCRGWLGYSNSRPEKEQRSTAYCKPGVVGIGQVKWDPHGLYAGQMHRIVGSQRRIPYTAYARRARRWTGRGMGTMGRRLGRSLQDLTALSQDDDLLRPLFRTTQGTGVWNQPPTSLYYVGIAKPQMAPI